MSDEIYDCMTYDGEEHVSLLTYPEIRDRLILLNGFSKTWAMTGWRLGWSIWPAPLYDKVRKLAVNCWSCVNAPTQFAGIAAIDGPQDDVTKMVAAFDRRRKVVTELLNTLPGRVLHHAEGRLLCLPECLGDRLAGEEARQRAARRGRRGADRRAGFRRATARATSASPTPTPRRTSAGPSSGWAISSPAAMRAAPTGSARR